MGAVLMGFEKPDLAIPLSDALTQAGHVVAVANAPLEVQHRMQQESFDAIVLDFYLLSSSRQKFIRALRTTGSNPAPPIILIIGNGAISPRNARTRAELLKPHAVLQAPINIKKFFNVVDKAVSAHQEMGPSGD